MTDMNLFSLRQNLVDVFQQVKDGKMDIKAAKALTGTADKIIATVKTQIRYHESRDEKPDIKFVSEAAGK